MFFLLKIFFGDKKLMNLSLISSLANDTDALQFWNSENWSDDIQNHAVSQFIKHQLIHNADIARPALESKLDQELMKNNTNLLTWVIDCVFESNGHERQ